MTFSEVSDLIEIKGMAQAMVHIYEQYQLSKTALEDARRILNEAESENNSWFSAADNFVNIAVQREQSITEGESHVVRIVKDNQVISFRADPDQKVFIGYWPLSKL